MILRPAVVAIALALRLFAADADADVRCGGEIDYDDWECVYVPRSGWQWGLVPVGTFVQSCNGGHYLIGRSTTCERPSLTETCGGGETCKQEAEGQEHPPCNEPMPDPSRCTGPVAPADREGWALHDGTAGPYTPDDRFSYNSTGHPNQISNPSLGSFTVVMPGLGGLDGNVQVVAYGPSNDRCHVQGWSGMPDLRVNVRCFTPAGLYVNTPFLVYFFATDDTATSTREIGHARYDLPPPEPEDFEPPDPAFQWNSNGAPPVTTRLEAGSYRVRFRNMTHPDGAAVVTALGTGPQFCQVLSTAPYAAGADTGTEVRVWCFDMAGRLADSGFTLRYEWRRLVSASPAREGYAFANQASLASYTPSLQFNSTGAPNTAARSSTGVYALTYRNLPAPEPWPDPHPNLRTSTVLLSAQALGPSYCKVVSWDGTAGETTVDTRCFNYAGALSDRRYQQMYLTRLPPQPPNNP